MPVLEELEELEEEEKFEEDDVRETAAEVQRQEEEEALVMKQQYSELHDLLEEFESPHVTEERRMEIQIIMERKYDELETRYFSFQHSFTKESSEDESEEDSFLAD